MLALKLNEKVAYRITGEGRTLSTCMEACIEYATTIYLADLEDALSYCRQTCVN